MKRGYHLPRGIRLILALATFIALITAGLFGLMHTHPPAPKKLAAPKLQQDPTPLFYKQIGLGLQSIPENTQNLRFTLEVYLTEKREEAEQKISELKKQGLDAYYTPLSRGGKIIYRVRHGIYASSSEAAAIQLALKKKHEVGTKIIKLQ